MSDKLENKGDRGHCTDGTDQMADERKVRLDEKYIPAWVIAEAVGKAIDEDVRGVEPRGGQTFAVLVDRSQDTASERQNHEEQA